MLPAGVTASPGARFRFFFLRGISAGVAVCAVESERCEPQVRQVASGRGSQKTARKKNSQPDRKPSTPKISGTGDRDTKTHCSNKPSTRTPHRQRRDGRSTRRGNRRPRRPAAPARAAPSRPPGTPSSGTAAGPAARRGPCRCPPSRRRLAAAAPCRRPA